MGEDIDERRLAAGRLSGAEHYFFCRTFTSLRTANGEHETIGISRGLKL